MDTIMDTVMERNKFPGKFIVFEGLDGSGQTTECNLLAEFLESKGIKILKTKEPTPNSPAGKIIRKILDKEKKSSPSSLQKLFCQDRKWHLEKEIIPALKQGKIVICDRYLFSTLSYGAAEGISYDWLFLLNKDFLLPDILFFLDVKPDICLERIEKRGKGKTIFEKKKKLEKIYKNYQKVLKEFEKSVDIFKINGEKSVKKVFGDIKKIYESKKLSSNH